MILTRKMKILRQFIKNNKEKIYYASETSFFGGGKALRKNYFNLREDREHLERFIRHEKHINHLPGAVFYPVRVLAANVY